MEFLEHARYAIIGAGVAMVLALLARLNRQTRPMPDGETAHRISASRVQIVTFALVSLCMAAAAGYGTYYYYMTFRYTQAYLPVGLSLFFTFSGLSLIAYLRRSFDVVWDKTGVEGPSRFLQAVMGRGRARIAFNEIAKAGTDWGGSYCIWNAQGVAIKWNYLYKGYARLNEAIAEARLDLFVDEDEFDDDLCD